MRLPTNEEFFGDFYPIIVMVLTYNHEGYKQEYFKLIDRYGYEKARDIMTTLHELLKLCGYSE